MEAALRHEAITAFGYKSLGWPDETCYISTYMYVYRTLKKLLLPLVSARFFNKMYHSETKSLYTYLHKYIAYTWYLACSRACIVYTTFVRKASDFPHYSKGCLGTTVLTMFKSVQSMIREYGNI